MVVHKRLPKPPITLASRDNKSKLVCRAFAKGCKGKISPFGETFFKRIATYGIKRGTDQAIKKSKEYWYIDNGYMGQRDHYFKICYNSIVHSGKGDYPKDRFNQLDIKLKDWRKTGDHIVLCPASPRMNRFLGLEDQPGDWTERTIEEIQKYTDRKIVVSTKFGDGIRIFSKIPSKHPFQEVIKNAWAVVTYNSSVIVKSVAMGVPVISLSPERKIGSLSSIENPLMERGFLYSLAYNQWSIQEIESGQAWRELNERP